MLRSGNQLYQQIYDDCKKEWRKLYRDRYAEMWRYLKDGDPDEDELDELLELEMSRLLFVSHPVTKYILDAEVTRKRDRLWEDLLASPTKTQRQLAVEKAMRLWAQMIGWYTDFAAQDAEIQALQNAGVKRVQRHESNDEKVCQICRELDKKIYETDKIPPLEHLRCRRWFTPVKA